MHEHSNQLDKVRGKRVLHTNGFWRVIQKQNNSNNDYTAPHSLAAYKHFGTFKQKAAINRKKINKHHPGEINSTHFYSATQFS